jgi:[CysO sulfur-carrier protein]-thiocarboxylate-dependent cysteine synthase
MTAYRSVLDMVGNTPLVELTELSPKREVRILAKLEGQNPTGSVKDRIALAMVEAAEADGSLRQGQTILEPSSGNTGIGLAMVCRVKGYKLKIVLPENVSPERRQLLEIMGAEVISSPGDEGSNGAVRMAQRLVKEMDDVAFLYQYGNPNNPRAHYEGTGPEIWRDCPEITHFVAGLGTAGTLMGTGRFLKERNPEVQVWAVEPPAGEMVDGLKNFDEGFTPPVFVDGGGEDLLDRKMMVRPRESVEWTRRLTDAGLFVGISSGAAMAGAAKCAAAIDEGVVVTIAADGGWKYLSTGVWIDDIDTVVERAKRTIYF